MAIDTILSTTYHCQEDQEMAIYELLNLTGPGASVLLEPDNRIMVWASEEDSIDDDGANAVYRSRSPISPAAWEHVRSLAWIETAE